jgi:hypothetical protein
METMQRFARSGAAVMRKPRDDVVEAVRISADSAVEIECPLRVDALASVWRSGGDAENQLKAALCLPIQGRQIAGDRIEQENKSRGRRGPAGNRVEQEMKWSRRPSQMGNKLSGAPNGLSGEIEREMRSGGEYQKAISSCFLCLRPL